VDGELGVTGLKVDLVRDVARGCEGVTDPSERPDVVAAQAEQSAAHEDAKVPYFDLLPSLSARGALQ
jgi:outer membrane protein TolC